MDYQRTLSDQSRIFARFTYHWPDYYGEGNWNLRTDLAHPKSLSHKAEGKGTTFTIGTEYKLNQQCFSGMAGGFSRKLSKMYRK